MNSFSFLPFAVGASLLSSALLTAQTAPAAAAADPYRDEAAVYEHIDTKVHMKADGTGDRLTHVVLRVQSEGLARQFSVLTVSYASANEMGSFDSVRVHKADGTTVETPAADAMEMPAEVSRQAPVYSDIKEKHLPVRSLSVGDRLEYQFRTVRTKAEAPNQFWGAEHFIVQDGVILSQTLTLQVPDAAYVQVWSPKHPATPTVKDGLKTWTWASSQTKPSERDSNGTMKAAEVKDPDEDADGRKIPSIAWTTFHNWAEIGDWYRGLALSRAEPTDAVRTKAAELTKDAKTPEDQVRALYRYVALQTRYVGISLGVGRYQPHAAADVLGNQYGDCKDKDTLLESLLKAKGFTTAPALIGAGIVPVPEVPTPAVFNHVITTVEVPGTAGRIWLDSTAEVAPYRVLMPVIRDQNALVVPASAPASLQKTPADPPFPYKEVFKAEGTLNDKGLMKGHMHMSVRSDSELGLRVLMRQISPSQWDQSMQYLSGVMGFGGKVSNADLHQSDPDGPVQISYDYTREDYADWKNGNILPLFPALEITTVDKDKQPEHDIDLGSPRTLEAHTVITLPEGYRAELPEAVHVKRDFSSYDQTYRLADGKLYVDRVVTVTTHKLPKAQWRDYYAFTKAIGMENGENYIRLIAPVTKSTTKDSAQHLDEKATTSASDSNDQQLMTDAASAEQRGDYVEAKRLLLQLREHSPNAPYLMSMLGFLAARDGKLDEAIADTETEFKNHPDDRSAIYILLAGYYGQQKRYDQAEIVLKRYRDQTDSQISLALANVQAAQGHHDDAVKTLQSAFEAHTDDRNAELALANELYEAHRYDDAAQHARHAMQDSDDPYLLNNAVYLLSEMKRDLSFAEERSRRSIELLEKKTEETSLEAANSRAFGDSAMLTAAWDTLAYILLLEGKPRDAEPLFYAAWQNRPDIVIGNHLAQTYEALGRKPDALAIYKLAASSDGASLSKADNAAVQESIKRLDNQGIKPSTQPSLQDMRTHELKRLADIAGGGTVRLQIANGTVKDAMLVSGDGKLKPTLDLIRGMALKGYTPPGSQGRVLRDAVLYCGQNSPSCDLVFMLRNGIGAEGDAR